MQKKNVDIHKTSYIHTIPLRLKTKQAVKVREHGIISGTSPMEGPNKHHCHIESSMRVTI